MAIGQETTGAKQNAPPESPSPGDIHIVGDSGSGTWSGRAENVLAVSVDGTAWLFRTPVAGERVYSTDKNADIVYDGTNWLAIGAPFTLLYQATHATAENSNRFGRLTSSSTNSSGIIPSGRSALVLSCEFSHKTGADAGTYTVFGLLRDVGNSANYLLGAAWTGAQNTRLRESRFGSIESPLALVDGGAATRFSVGWRNESSSPGAMASEYASCYVAGFYVEKL
jgi:hypothetical protein